MTSKFLNIANSVLLEQCPKIDECSILKEVGRDFALAMNSYFEISEELMISFFVKGAIQWREQTGISFANLSMASEQEYRDHILNIMMCMHSSMREALIDVASDSEWLEQKFRYAMISVLGREYAA